MKSKFVLIKRASGEYLIFQIAIQVVLEVKGLMFNAMLNQSKKVYAKVNIKINGNVL